MADDAGAQRGAALITDVVLPQMGLEVAEGVVTTVNVDVGDAVEETLVVAEVETDKAIAEVPASRAGVIVAIEVAEGDTVPVGGVLVRIGDSLDEAAAAAVPVEPAASPAGTASPAGSASPAEPGSPPPGAAPPPAVAPPSGPEGPDGARRRRVAPIARRVAAEHGIDIEVVPGSGPAGRVTLADVERAIAAGTAGPPAPAGAVSDAAAPSAAASRSAEGTLEPLSPTRQSIARRLTESQLVPQYTLSREIDAAWLLAEKQRLSGAGPVRVGVLDLLLQALGECLERHRELAASFVPGRDGEPPSLRRPHGTDLGLAVATDRGLLVPVIRGVERRSLRDIVLERDRLVGLARSGRLGPADMGGAQGTLSSLGTFGVDSFTAMLNPGESSILAVGRTVEKAIPRDGGIAAVPTLSLTFTFDHRVVDGATGAAALAALADLLEGGIEWRA